MKKKKSTAISINLIAPCGMNCRLCWGYIREKNTCPGCRRNDSHHSQKSKYRNTCKIRNCEQIAKSRTNYCSISCSSFPCARLKQLDKRYRIKYEMSMIENLAMINNAGVRQFIRNEKIKWSCPECGETICVHKSTCPSCEYNWR